MNESYELEHFTPQPDVSLIIYYKVSFKNLAK